MSTTTEIASQALALLGQTPLTSLETDETTTAQLARTHFWPVADQLMEEHNWNFNQFRSPSLAPDATAPAFGYTTRFALPTDPWCLRVLGTSEDDVKEDWSVEGRHLLMDVGSVQIHYLGRETNTGLWSARFVACYVPRLAWTLAYSITQSMNVMRDLNALFEQELRRSRGIDGREQPPKAIRSTTLTTDVR